MSSIASIISSSALGVAFTSTGVMCSRFAHFQ
jgi:hypothetical protein